MVKPALASFLLFLAATSVAVAQDEHVSWIARTERLDNDAWRANVPAPSIAEARGAFTRPRSEQRRARVEQDVEDRAQAAPAPVIHVDDDAAPDGDGTGRFPFENLPDAIAAARGAEGRVTVVVAPGDYALASTLVIEGSLDLRGSTEQLEGADHWPSGDLAPGTATRIFASSPSLEQLMVVRDGGDTVLTDVTIQGFVFEGPAAGVSLTLTRVQRYRIADNVFRAPAQFALQTIASSGLVSGNHFSGVGTGAILAGGYPESPSSVTFQGNRVVRTGIGALLLNGASIDIPELGDEVDVVVRDNDLSENTRGQGFGFRAFILRRDPGAPGDSQSSARVRALLQNNRIVGNRFGIDLDAGFPHRRVGTTCDPRVFSGSIDLRLVGNILSGSVLASGLVTFTRNTAALTPSTLSQWQYLHGATFRIDDAEAILADAWIDHPATDSLLGPCPADATHEALDNTLVYNGHVLIDGRNF